MMPLFDSLPRWRREIAAGTRVGPRVVAAGPLVQLGAAFDTVRGWPLDVGVSTPAQARRVVDSLQQAGVDFIKVHDDFPRDVYFALAAEARRIGIPFAGHLPQSVTLAEASDSGQHSIEHTVDFWGPCWRVDSAGEQQCAALAAQFRRHGTWFTPTVFTPEPDTVQRPAPEWYAHYVPDTTKPGWSFEDQLWIVHQSHRFGMPLLAGTDAAIGLGMIAGPESKQAPAIHRELERLVDAGLSPLEALQTATLNPAKYLGATDSLGTVAPGQVADLVLLDANPLVDIRHTRQIRAVVANGRYFDRAALDGLITAARVREEQRIAWYRTLTQGTPEGQPGP